MKSTFVKRLIATVMVIILGMSMLISVDAKNKEEEEKTQEILQYKDFYDPSSELANMYYVNMDGEVDIEIPDFAVTKVEIVVADGKAPSIEGIKNEKGEALLPEKIAGNDKDFNIYKIDAPKKGEWVIQLDGNEYEKMKVFVLYHSSNVAKFSFENELENPKSANCQALMRIYDSTEEEVLDLKDMTVLYDVNISGEDYDLSMTKKIDDCYMGGLLGGKVNSYTATVVVQQGEGIKVLPKTVKADEDEFQKLLEILSPGLFVRVQNIYKEFKNNPASYLAALAAIAVFLTIIVVSVGMYLKKRKNKIDPNDMKVEEYIDYADKVEKITNKLGSIFSEEGMKKYISDVAEIAQWKEFTDEKSYTLERTKEMKKLIDENTAKVRSLLNVWDKEMDNLGKVQLEELKKAIDSYYTVLERAYQMTDKKISALKNYMNEITYFEKQERPRDYTLQINNSNGSFKIHLPAKLQGRTKKEKGMIDLARMEMRDKKGLRTGKRFELEEVKVCIIFKGMEPILVSNHMLDAAPLKDAEKDKQKFGPYRYSLVENQVIRVQDAELSLRA